MIFFCDYTLIFFINCSYIFLHQKKRPIILQLTPQNTECHSVSHPCPLFRFWLPVKVSKLLFVHTLTRS
ncbi:hypothetical protein EBZ70_08490 [bacterium]|nr:hypothetical protein [bacterium]